MPAPPRLRLRGTPTGSARTGPAALALTTCPRRSRRRARRPRAGQGATRRGHAAGGRARDRARAGWNGCATRANWAAQRARPMAAAARSATQAAWARRHYAHVRPKAETAPSARAGRARLDGTLRTWGPERTRPPGRLGPAAARSARAGWAALRHSAHVRARRPRPPGRRGPAAARSAGPELPPGRSGQAAPADGTERTCGPGAATARSAGPAPSDGHRYRGAGRWHDALRVGPASLALRGGAAGEHGHRLAAAVGRDQGARARSTTSVPSPTPPPSRCARSPLSVRALRRSLGACGIARALRSPAARRPAAVQVLAAWWCSRPTFGGVERGPGHTRQRRARPREPSGTADCRPLLLRARRRRSLAGRS